MAIALYIATVLGAAGLFLMLPKRSQNLPALGGLLAAAGLGLAWLFPLMNHRELLADTGLDSGAFNFHYIFSALAIGAAVRVITHTRPVYAALWFVLAVLASAGLFLTLSAEFMAFAMVLIYAGAILVTYMFVIMLATQAREAEAPENERPEYERFAREPLAAVAAGFILLATLLFVAFDDLPDPQLAGSISDETLATEVLNDPAEHEARVDLGLAQNPSISNAERVGIDLFRGNPLGLELAGVILLVSLVGAVVIAKKRIEEEELDEADPAAPSTEAADA